MKYFMYEYKKLPIWEIYISYLKFTRDCLMYPGDLSFWFAIHLQRNFLDHHLKPLMRELLLHQGYWKFFKESAKYWTKSLNILYLGDRCDKLVSKHTTTLTWRLLKIHGIEGKIKRYLFLLEICVTSNFVTTDIHCNTCHTL